MIANILNYLRPRIAYQDPFLEQRARALLTLLAVGLPITIIASLYAIFVVFSQITDPSFIQWIAIVSPAIVVISIITVRNGFYRATSIGIILFTLLGLSNFWDASLNNLNVLLFALPIVAAGMLRGWRSTLLTFFVAVGISAGPTLLTELRDIAPDDFLVFNLILSIITAFIIVFSTNMKRTASTFIKEFNKLQDILSNTLRAGQEQDENRAAINTINIIRDQLGYTFARIYLVEDNEVIQRIQPGLSLEQINIDTDFKFSKRSGIYEAIHSRDVVTMLKDDNAVLREHLLSGTNAALAVPVIDSESRIIVVMDIQSEDLASFTPQEIQTVKIVAAQLGQTIERLRLIAELRRDLFEQDDMIARQRTRLLQYERAERQITTETWRDYLQHQGVDYLGYDMTNPLSDPIEATTISEEIRSTIETGDISVEQDGKQQVVSVPISLRGQTLGAMSFRVPAGTQIVGARQQELIRNVVQRLSLALENKRLFEQSQSQAQRESKANEVGNILLSSTDINTVLQLAAENFNAALGAVQTQIRLKPDVQELGEGEVTS